MPVLPVNLLTGFYMRASLALNGLKQRNMVYSSSCPPPPPGKLSAFFLGSTPFLSSALLQYHQYYSDRPRNMRMYLSFKLI